MYSIHDLEQLRTATQCLKQADTCLEAIDQKGGGWCDVRFYLYKALQILEAQLAHIAQPDPAVISQLQADETCNRCGEVTPDLVAWEQYKRICQDCITEITLED